MSPLVYEAMSKRLREWWSYTWRGDKLNEASALMRDLRDELVLTARDEEIVRLREELRRARAVITLHQQNGCGARMVEENQWIEGRDSR